MRVLHVIDAGRPLLRELTRPRHDFAFDVQALACRDVTTSTPYPYEHRVCILGNAAAAHRAAGLDLAVHQVIPPPLGRAHLAVGPVGRLIKAVRPDLVHWWGGRWTGGCFGRPGRAWRLESMLGSTPLRMPLWLSRGAAVACGPAESASAERSGLRVIEAPVPLFPIASPTQRPDGPCRVLLLQPGADAREFIFMCGLIWGSGVRLTGVFSTSSAGRARTRRVLRTFQYPVRMVPADLPFTQLVSGCAAAIWMGPSRPNAISAAASIRTCLAAGVPVAVPFEMEWAVPHPLRARCVARNSTPNELARVLTNILNDRQRLADDARRLFADASPAAAFTQAVIAGYEDKPVPTPAATAAERAA